MREKLEGVAGLARQDRAGIEADSPQALPSTAQAAIMD